MRERVISEEEEVKLRERLAAATKSGVAGYPPESLRQLLDDARTLRELLDSERQLMADVLSGIPGAGDRIAVAREQIARGEGIPLEIDQRAESRGRVLGERLLDASGIYGAAAFSDGIGFRRVAVVGLVGRARGLLRALHHLLDAGDVLEAQLMSRALVEYAITFAWFRLDPDLHMAQWLIEDLRLTLVLDQELRDSDGEGVLADQRRADLEELRQQLIDDYKDRGTALPNLKDRATACGLGLAYSLAYRYESKSGIHPTTLAAEQILTHWPQVGKYEIRDEPPADLSLPDIAAVGATLLLVILEVAQELVPEMPMDAEFADVQKEILALAPLPPPSTQPTTAE